MTAEGTKPVEKYPAAMDRRFWLGVGGIFLLLAAVHLAWLRLNDRPPMWDSALHLTYALRYLHFIQAPGFSLQGLLALTPYYPPLFYLLLVPVLAVRCGPDAATLVHLPFLFVLLASTGWLGVRWTGRRGIGLLAAFLAGTFPHVLWLGRDVMIDLEVVAITALALALAVASGGFSRRGPTLALGIACGAGLLLKWSVAFYLAAPLLWLALAAWRAAPRGAARRRMLENLLTAAVAGGALAWPWYLRNIGFLASHFIPYTQGLGPLEGDPRLWSLAGWTFYLRALMGWQLFAVFFVLLLISIVGLLRRNRAGGIANCELRIADSTDSGLRSADCGLKSEIQNPKSAMVPQFAIRNSQSAIGVGFLLSWILGTYVIFSLFANKAPRHLSPVLPAAALLIAGWAGTVRSAAWRRGLTALCVAVAALQAWLVSFGIAGLPESVNLRQLPQPAYAERSLSVDNLGRAKGESVHSWADGWFLYHQEAFGIWGPPRQEDWHIPEILAFCDRTPDPPREPKPRDVIRAADVARAVPGDVARAVPGAWGENRSAQSAQHAPGGRGVRLGLVPDAARFNVWSFRAMALIMGLDEAAIWRISALDEQGACFDPYRFILVKDGTQGPVWNTSDNAKLMNFLAAYPERFYPVASWRLPDGSLARLYQNVNSVPPPPAWPPDF